MSLRNLSGSIGSCGITQPAEAVNFGIMRLLKTQASDMQQPNAQSVVEVTSDELPIHCPTPDSTLWNSHPRVYIPLEDAPEATCAYCGTVYRLVKKKSASA